MVLSPEEQRRARELEAELRRNWVSRRDAAKLMDVTGEYIHSLAATGRIATLNTPSGRLYWRADVQRLAEQREEDRQVREQRRGASPFDIEGEDGRDRT